MIRTKRLQHEFVEFIPETLDHAKIYISMEFATASHQCCCGCGREVVTPFSPRDWNMTFDGEAVSLSPSIGNWKFRCRSHYFIRRGHVVEVPSLEECNAMPATGRVPHEREQKPWFTTLRKVWRSLFS